MGPSCLLQIACFDLAKFYKISGAFGNSQFCYLSSTLCLSLLHVHYLHAKFATQFILPFYHSTSMIFQNQHLDLKKSALLKLKWVPCFSILSWLSSGPSIAHDGTVALTRQRKHKTSKEQSKLLILQYFLYFIKLYISESICTLKRFLLRVT